MYQRKCAFEFCKIVVVIVFCFFIYIHFLVVVVSLMTPLHQRKATKISLLLEKIEGRGENVVKMKQCQVASSFYIPYHVFTTFTLRPCQVLTSSTTFPLCYCFALATLILFLVRSHNDQADRATR